MSIFVNSPFDIFTAYTFHKDENGVVYVLNNDGFVIKKEDASQLLVGLRKFVEDVPEDEILEHNNKRHKELYEYEKSNQVSSKPKRIRPGYIYFIKADNGLTKIGKAIDLNKRLDHFTAKLPYELKLVHSIKTNDYTGLELLFHKRYDHLRTRGEWFNLTDADIEDVKREYGGEHTL